MEEAQGYIKKKQLHNVIRKTEDEKEKKKFQFWAGYKKIILEKWVDKGNNKEGPTQV